MMVKVSRSSSVLSLVAYGVLLGMCLGCLSSVATFTIWRHFGRLKPLIRPGWEESYCVFMVVSGGFVGIVYGVVLCIMNNRPRTYIMWLLSFLLTVAQATVIYLIGDYAAVRLQSVLVWLIEHPIVFLLSLTTVAWLGRLSSSKAAGTEIPPEEQNLSGC